MAAAFALTVNNHIHLNVGSVKPRLAKVDGLDPAARTFLQDEGIVYLTDLEVGGSTEIWRQMEGVLGRERTHSTRSLVELYLHQGIGVEYGNLLVKASIRFAGGFGRLIRYAQVEERTYRASRECSTAHPSANSPVDSASSKPLTLPRIGRPGRGRIVIARWSGWSDIDLTVHNKE